MTTGGVKDTIDNLIRTHKVAIFSKQGCPYCLGARNTVRKYFGKILTQNDVIFYGIDSEKDTREIQNYLRLLSGNPTYPLVFINGQFIGGLEKLTTLHKSGELENMLRAGHSANTK